MTIVPRKRWRGRKYPPGKAGSSDLKRKSLLLIAGVIVLAVVSGVVGTGLFNWLAHSDFFQITSIRVQGTRKVAKAAVLELCGVDLHSNLLSADRADVEQRLRSHPWIKEVRVERDWPSRLLIRVQERKAEALVYGGDGWYFVDRDGVVFSPAMAGDDLDFPVITGMKGEAWRNGKNKGITDALQLLRRAGRGNTNLPKQNISELHVTKDGDIILFLANRPIPIYLGQGDMGRKFGRLAKVLGWLYRKKEFGEATAIRLDYLGKKVLVERAGSG